MLEALRCRHTVCFSRKPQGYPLAAASGVLTHLKQTEFPAAGFQPGPGCLLEPTEKGCLGQEAAEERLREYTDLEEEPVNQ